MVITFEILSYTSSFPNARSAPAILLMQAPPHAATLSSAYFIGTTPARTFHSSFKSKCFI